MENDENQKSPLNLNPIYVHWSNLTYTALKSKTKDLFYITLDKKKNPSFCWLQFSMLETLKKKRYT